MSTNFEDCPCSGKTLSRLVKPALLALLSRENQHGYIIVKQLTELDQFREHPPDTSGVYKMLKDMEDDGLVASVVESAERGLGKRTFSLTMRGRLCLERWKDSLRVYRDQIDDMLSFMS